MTTYVRERGASGSTITTTASSTGVRTNAAAGTTSGDATVTDANVVAGDAGSPVSGTNIPANSYIGAVTAGVSFELVNAAGAAVTATGTGTVTITVVSAPVLLAANAARVGAVVFNDSTQVLYLRFGAKATSTAFTYKLAAGEVYALPRPVYIGTLSGVWASANGNARVTELT